MSIYKTLIAAVLFAAAVGLFITEQRRLARIEERRLQSTRLVPFPKEEIDSISMIRSGIPLDFRKEDQWRIVNPVIADADQQAVADLIFFLDEQQRTGGQEIEEGELATFGLQDPALTVSVGGAGQTAATTLHVGNDSPAYGQVYARLDGAPEWFTISSDLRDYLRKPLFDYRDKSIFTLNAEEATTVTITSEGSTIEIAKSDLGWNLTRPTPMKADDARVGQLLKDIQSTKVADFIDTETLRLDAYGLEVPYIAAKIYSPAHDENPSQTLFIGRRRGGEPPQYYAQCLERDAVFTVPQNLVDSLRVTVSDLRDKQLFTIAKSEIDWFTLEFSNNLISLRKDSAGHWRFEDDGTTEVNQEAVNSRIDQLLRLRAIEFFEFPPMPEQSGLDAPIVRVVLSDAAGGKIEGLMTGKIAGTPGREFVYARRLNDDKVLSIPAGFTSRFFIARDDLRDRTLFAFDPELVTRIDVTDGGKKVTFTQDGDIWLGANEGGGNPYQVSPASIHTLVLGLLGLQWEENLKPEVEADLTLVKTMQLETPSRTISFYDEAGEPLARIGQGESNQQRTFIRRGENEYFAVDKIRYAEFVGRLQDVIPQQ
jgi:hypothetical protein